MTDLHIYGSSPIRRYRRTKAETSDPCAGAHAVPAHPDGDLGCIAQHVPDGCWSLMAVEEPEREMLQAFALGEGGVL